MVKKDVPIGFAKGGQIQLKKAPKERNKAEGGAQVVIRTGKDGKLKVFARMPKGKGMKALK